MVRRQLQRFLKFLAIFGVLIAVWQGALFMSLLRPAFVATGLIAEPERTHVGFTYSTLGIQAPLVVAAQTSPLETASWAEIRRALTEGVSLAFDAATLAEARLAFVTGHSSDTYPHAYSTVFAPLGQARLGDSFVLGVDDKEYQYRVIERHVLSPFVTDQFLALAPDDDDQARVALVTCWPPLTTTQRLVVVGERVVE